MLRKLIPDPFILVLLAAIGLASLLPAHGSGLSIVSKLANVAIFSLFFFHGLRLAREAVLAGLKNWRLQAATFGFTFAALPLAGLTLASALPNLLPQQLWIGVLFLSALPSTVQAAIASASMAKGNVAASVVSAALSNIGGVVMTPLIFAAIANMGGVSIDPSTIGRIALLLLMPFALGQILRSWFADWAERNRVWIGRLDRLTIVITVYTAFSAAVNEGLWARLDGADLLTLTVLLLLLQGSAFAATWQFGKVLGFSREDRISLMFSGTHKSLATGAPMARILFPAASAGMIIVPLMLYHQMQLMASAVIAGRLGRADQTQNIGETAPPKSAIDA